MSFSLCLKELSLVCSVLIIFHIIIVLYSQYQITLRGCIFTAHLPGAIKSINQKKNLKKKSYSWKVACVLEISAISHDKNK